VSDQLTLEGVALDKKDRSELQSIVTALGGKVSARAKKADLIQQILDLSGVTSGRSGTAPSSPPDQSSAAAQRPGAADEPRLRPGTEPAARPGGEVPGRPGPEGGTGPADDHPERSERQPAQRTVPEPGDRGGGEPSRFRPPGLGRPDGGPGVQGARAVTRPEGRVPRPDGGDDRADGAGDRGEPAEGGDLRDDEAGVRRRRRRGRERDRDRDREESTAEPVAVEGHLDLRDEGYGFLRVHGFLPTRDDVYVSVKHVRQYGLRRGDLVAGLSRPAARNEKNPALQVVETVNGRPVGELRERRRFEDLTPLFPDVRLRLESRDDPRNMTARIIDLVAPIGKGQRGLIVSPPKAGKTTVMKQIARAIELNNPEVELIVLLVDERPEEVTDMRRWLQRGSVVASTFDRPSEEHCALAELTIERSKRMVEEGRDVCIILDGITRLARAYNLAAPPTGRIMSGGVDSGALYPPKKFFGAARNLEEGGSLTILATALVDTGSKMDEVIFEEFKGTGNMELRLDRRMAERRIFPAIDVSQSSTRHEELLFDRRQVGLIYKLRRVLAGLADESNPAAATELLIDRLASFRTNDEFLAEIAKAPSA
jgi:transcription termination factor Rho